MHVFVSCAHLCSFNKRHVEVLHIYCGVSCDSLDGSNMPQSSEYRSKNQQNLPSLTLSHSYFLFVVCFRRQAEPWACFRTAFVFCTVCVACTSNHFIYFQELQLQRLSSCFNSSPAATNYWSSEIRKNFKSYAGGTFVLPEKCIMLDDRIIQNEYKHTCVLSILSPWTNHGKTSSTHFFFYWKPRKQFHKRQFDRAIYEICLVMWLVLVSFRFCFLINIKCWETQ